MAQDHQNNFWRYKAEVGFCGALLALSAAACSGNHQTSPQPPSANPCPNISPKVFLNDRALRADSTNSFLKRRLPEYSVRLIAEEKRTGAILESGDSTCTYIVDRAAPFIVNVTYSDAASSNLFTHTYDYDGEFLNSGNHKIAPQPPSENLCPSILPRVFSDIASKGVTQSINQKIDGIALRKFPRHESGAIGRAFDNRIYTGAILNGGDVQCTYLVDRAAPFIVNVTYRGAASSKPLQFIRTYDYNGKFSGERPTR